MALDAYDNNSDTVPWSYNSSAVAKVYHGHLDELKQIESKKEHHIVQFSRNFFRLHVCSLSLFGFTKLTKPFGGSTPGGSISTNKKTDYQNLPDSFSD